MTRFEIFGDTVGHSISDGPISAFESRNGSPIKSAIAIFLIINFRWCIYLTRYFAYFGGMAVLKVFYLGAVAANGYCISM